MLTNPITSIWDLPFDVAYTTKQSRFPFNGGVLFVRVSAGSRQFLEEYRAENARFFKDSRTHQVWRSRYGGVNQAAFGSILEGGIAKRLGLTIAKVPCLEWNCEDSQWEAFNPALTKIVHLKSALRRAALVNTGAAIPKVRVLANIWRKLDAAISPGFQRPRLAAAAAPAGDRIAVARRQMPMRRI